MGRNWMGFASLVLLVLLIAGPAHGIGLGLLYQTEESSQYSFSVKSGRGTYATSAAIAWQNGFYYHMDYLVHFHLMDRKLPLYVGLGGRLFLDEEPHVALRIPVGISINVSLLELFFEAVPIVTLVNPNLETRFNPINLGLGIRLHFD